MSEHESKHFPDAAQRLEAALAEHGGRIKFSRRGQQLLRQYGLSAAEAERAARILEKAGKVAIFLRVRQDVLGGRVVRRQELDVRLVAQAPPGLSEEFKEILRYVANMRGWDPNGTAHEINRLVRQNPERLDDLHTMLAESFEAAVAEVMPGFWGGGINQGDSSQGEPCRREDDQVELDTSPPAAN